MTDRCMVYSFPAGPGIRWPGVLSRLLPVLVLCLTSCISSFETGRDTVGMDLKQQAVEDKAAIRKMMYEAEKQASPQYLALARRLVKGDFFDVALVQLESAEKAGPGNAEVYFLKGTCFRGKKKYADALRQYEKALALNPDLSYAYNGMGLAHDAVGDHEKADQCYRQAIRIDPGVAAFHNNMGVSCLIRKKPEQAVIHLEQSVALNPGSLRVLNNLGLAYGLAGMEEKALDLFKRKAERAAAFNNMGYVWQISGRPDKALHWYERAIRANPGFNSARKNRHTVAAPGLPSRPGSLNPNLKQGETPVFPGE